MHYVKQFNINGIDTKQVACIELRGKPNAATEGCVGVLGIDILSPLHDVYKCIAVNGSIYTWELLSSGTCIMSSIITGAGEEVFEFPYEKLRTVVNYVPKVGDVIIDKEGFLYQVESVNYTSCIARYNGTQIVSGVPKVGQGDNGKIFSVVDGCHAWVPVGESSVGNYVKDTYIDPLKEDITKGKIVAGKAQAMNYTLKAKGSWTSAQTSDYIKSENIISATNFIKPNTRYLIKADGRLIDGFSNEVGTQIYFHHINVDFDYGVSAIDVDAIFHEARILYKEGKGLYFLVFRVNIGSISTSTGYQSGIPITHIYECETLPV